MRFEDGFRFRWPSSLTSSCSSLGLLQTPDVSSVTWHEQSPSSSSFLLLLLCDSSSSSPHGAGSTTGKVTHLLLVSHVVFILLKESLPVSPSCWAAEHSIPGVTLAPPSLPKKESRLCNQSRKNYHFQRVKREEEERKGNALHLLEHGHQRPLFLVATRSGTVRWQRRGRNHRLDRQQAGDLSATLV